MNNFASGLSIEVEVTDGQELAAALSPSKGVSVIGLRAGIYRGGLHFTRSVTLIGLDGAQDAILHATTGAVVLVSVDDVVVTLRNLTLTGGNAEVGGGVALVGFSEVTLEACSVRGNRARRGPGGGCYVEAGTLHLRDCEVRDNEAVGGVAIAVLKAGTLKLESTTVHSEPTERNASIVIRAAAVASLNRCDINATDGAAVRVAGTSSQRPEVRIAHSTLSGTPSLDLGSTFPGRTVVDTCQLSSPATGMYRSVGEVTVSEPPAGTARR